MVLSSEVGLHTLTVGRTTGVDVLARTVATNKANSLDGGLIEDEINGLRGAVNDVDDTRGEASLPSQLRQDHSSPWVPLRGLQDQTVTGNCGDRDTPKRNHSGEVCGSG